MKLDVILQILFDLLRKKKLTANELCGKYGFSSRTAYRYIGKLSQFVPLLIKRGRGGGIILSDCFALPINYMRKEEYEVIMQALEYAYGQNPNAKFIEARRKIASQIKWETQAKLLSADTGEIFIEGENELPTLELLQESIKQRILLEKGGKFADKIEPHALLLRKQQWFLFAFCHSVRAFRLLPLNEVQSLLKTGIRFRRRPFTRKDLPTE